MVEMDEEKAKVRMSGYLYKKTKKRMMTSWKNYWFVLCEERLLLYYRSKDEYEAISPCKGSINLGPPCAVKSLPSVPNAFQIATRTTNYTLKTQNPEDQKKWLQVLLSVLNQNQNFSTENKLNHFRYSLDELYPKLEPNEVLKYEDKPQENKELIVRLQKLGAHSYGGSLQTISKKLSVKIPSKKNLNASNGSLPETLNQEEENTFKEMRMRNHIYERLSDVSDRTSVMIDNDNYSVPIRKNSGGIRESKSLMVENDEYCGIERRHQSDEVIYSEPKIDVNKNVEEPYGYSRIKENIYEELDRFNLYSVSNKQEDSIQPTKLKKSKSFVQKMWKKKSKKNKQQEEIYSEVEPAAVEKVEMTDSKTVQMLSELQNILENKMATMKQLSPTEKSPKQDDQPEAEIPTLPPHQLEPVRSLDEILEDLDMEKFEAKSKVQLLIEKFSGPESDVILRKHDKVKITRDSGELNRLLDELTKVTSAPILTPGTTSSLVNPNLIHEEWLKILPIRKRRLSEPDYDIPRLLSLPTIENQKESDSMPATRFFGPILPSNEKTEEDSIFISMAPDSLEIEPKIEPVYSCPPVDDKILYAIPKPYFSVATHVVNTCQNFCGASMTDDCTIIYKTVKNLEDEVFKDSLELWN